MKPYFEQGKIAIYHADCRAVLPAVDRRTIDCMLTDPPYGISYMSAQRRPIANDDTLNILRDVLPIVDQILKPDSHCFVFSAPTMLSQSLDLVDQVLNVKDVLVWHKGNQGSRGDLQAGFSRNWEAILHASKGRRPLNRPRPKTILRYDWSSSRVKMHPTEKPAGLMSLLLSKSCQPGDLVLDPFMGSGPVLEAAKMLGLYAIGIELDERYCESAAERLMRTVGPEN